MKCPSCAQIEIGQTTRCVSCGADVTLLAHVQELGVKYFNASVAAAPRDTRQALLLAATAVAVDGHLVPARKLLGKLFWKSGLQDEALFYFKTAVDLAPNDVHARQLLNAAQARIAGTEPELQTEPHHAVKPVTKVVAAAARPTTEPVAAPVQIVGDKAWIYFLAGVAALVFLFLTLLRQA